jgi:hypothetical protein
MVLVLQVQRVYVYDDGSGTATARIAFESFADAMTFRLHGKKPRRERVAAVALLNRVRQLFKGSSKLLNRQLSKLVASLSLSERVGIICAVQ